MNGNAYDRGDYNSSFALRAVELKTQYNVIDFGFGLVFCLTSLSTIFQSFWDGATASWVFTSTLGTFKCLIQGHYTAVMGFEPWTSRSGVRSSTTEPSLSHRGPHLLIIEKYSNPTLRILLSDDLSSPQF